VLVEGLEHNTSHQFILQGLSPPSISPCWVAVDRELAPLEQWGYLVVGREIPSPPLPLPLPHFKETSWKERPRRACLESKLDPQHQILWVFLKSHYKVTPHVPLPVARWSTPAFTRGGGLLSRLSYFVPVHSFETLWYRQRSPPQPHGFDVPHCHSPKSI
jgi:hypothetical protein